jgi:hypothetical protein
LFALGGVLHRVWQRLDRSGNAHAESACLAALPSLADRSLAAAASDDIIEGSPSYARARLLPQLLLVLLLLLLLVLLPFPPLSCCCHQQEYTTPPATHAPSFRLSVLNQLRTLPPVPLLQRSDDTQKGFSLVSSHFAAVGVRAAQAEDDCSRRNCCQHIRLRFHSAPA